MLGVRDLYMGLCLACGHYFRGLNWHRMYSPAQQRQSSVETIELVCPIVILNVPSTHLTKLSKKKTHLTGFIQSVICKHAGCDLEESLMFLNLSKNRLPNNLEKKLISQPSNLAEVRLRPQLLNHLRTVVNYYTSTVL